MSPTSTTLLTLPAGDEPPPLTHSALELEAMIEVHRAGGRGVKPGLTQRARDGAARPREAADAAATAAHQASVVVTTLPEGGGGEGGGGGGSGAGASRIASSAHLGSAGAAGSEPLLRCVMGVWLGCWG